MIRRNQPIRLPGLKPGVCSGLILSGAHNPDLKIWIWRRRTYQFKPFTLLEKSEPWRFRKRIRFLSEQHG